MTNDNPPPTLALTLSDKLMAMNHLTTFVPEKLDVDAMNYSSWVYYFSHLYHGYGILDHLVDAVASSYTTTPTDPLPKDVEWTKIDFIIRSWIFSTLAPSLRKRLVDLNPTTAKDAWTYIEANFQDNKCPRAMALKAKLCNLKIGDLSINSNDDVVTFVLEGLRSTYETISTVIVSREPFPDLKMVRSLLTTHEMRLKSRVQNPLVDATSASPMVLLAKSNTSARCGPSLEKVNNLCWSFAKGSCRFSDACKYLHNGVHGKSTLLPHTSGSASSVPGVTRSDLDLLQSLLAKFGLNAPNISTPSPLVAYTVSVPPGNGWVIPTGGSVSDGVTTAGGPLSTARGSDAFWSTVGGSPYTWNFTATSSVYDRVEQQQGGSFPGLVHLGQSPSMPFHLSQLFASGSQGSGQATLLPNAFNTTTLQEPTSGNWNMDTCASSHLNDYVHYLSDILNMCIYPSVAVGDGHFIPVTNSGHNVLSTPFCPLCLNNVLITPNIVKNLISVRQFVRDNSCTVEFDPFGFSVKDFITRWYMWHQRLGHLGSEVLHHLVSSDSISYNKEKLPVLCHAYQLGKHVKILFVSSSSSVTSCFDIVHSDLWTSPILSLSGFQYYVLFLDHYSHLSVKLSHFNVIMVVKPAIRQPNTKFEKSMKLIMVLHTSLDERKIYSLAKKDFSKSKPVTTQNVSNDFSKPVTAQILPQNMLPIVKNTNVIAPGMYKVHTKPNQTRTPQLHQDIRKPNKRVSFSTGVIPNTSVSRPQLKSNHLEDRVMSNNSQGKKQEVEDHRRKFKFSNNKTSVTACNDSLNAKTSNVNFVCVTCGKCVLNDNHDLCVLHYINGVNSRTRQPMAVPISTREPKHNVNQSVATFSKKTVATDSTVKKSRNITRKLYEQVSKTCSWWYPKYTPSGYNWKPKSQKGNLVEIILFIVDSGCSKHMTGNLKLLTNFVEKFLGTVKFGNDQIAPILGYGDLVQGTITIKRVYYVEGLNHNLFSVGQFCDADLEVAFRKSTCYIRDLKGNDLLIGSRGTDLYSISLQDSTTPNPICLMAKATSSQAWLWHRHLSHLNFDTINLLSKNNIVNGLPKLKFVKDHLCSSCELGKAKRKSFHTKTTPSSKRRLQLLHMDLCGPMRVESINGKKYVLVIVDDYSRYTWTHFLRSKDETPRVLIDFLTLIQRGLHAQVTTVRTNKGTEFLNKTLHAYFTKEGIRHETSTARTPEQKGVVERRNRTLVEAA
ncbi:retrovirus-related pol polyprotein from transposon TNT 1-94 [Tanacetum coccineum]